MNPSTLLCGWRRLGFGASLLLTLVLAACQSKQASNPHVSPALTGGEAAWSAEVMAILDEGKNRNQVMEHLRHLTQGIGPRLTGSTRAKAANDWAAEQFRSWGLVNVEVREWGTIPAGFDRGPSYGRMVAPRGADREFEFTWSAWTPGTNGPVRGTLYREPATQEEFDAIAANLKGAWILQPARASGSRRGVIDPGGATPTDWLAKCREAGIAGVISVARGGEIVHTGGNFRNVDLNNLPTSTNISVRRSDYDAMNSRLADGEEVVVEFDCQATFIPGPVPCYNTIAEIPGTERPDEIVIISAHLDSWDGPGSQGTVDNGTGSSVTLETARILAASGVKPKRTIRFILWTGEEQGLLGSRAYVDSLSEEELSKISAVFVDDGGTNYQGGLQVIESMAPMLAEATAPVNHAFPDMPVAININPRMPRGGASDHASFNAKGVPGFFWDEVGRADYRYAWHTQNDKFEQGIPEYLVQSSTCSAVTAFNLANAETLLPRQQPLAEGEEEEQPRPRRRPASEQN